MRRIAILVVLSLALFATSEVKAQTLAVTGPCPGVMTFDVTGASPFARIAFIYSLNTGSWTVPSGFPCTGLVTGLAWPVGFGGWTEADVFGNASVNAFIPSGWCGTRYVQAVDALACTTTNVILIP